MGGGRGDLAAAFLCRICSYPPIHPIISLPFQDGFSGELSKPIFGGGWCGKMPREKKYVQKFRKYSIISSANA